MAQQITVNPVTRIEGHAKIILDLDDRGEVSNAHLQVLELRGFEKLLEGMELLKMPQVTARLCGVCPAAHHLASVAAIEAGLDIKPPHEAKLLRELLYVGHMLHSHALSCFVLAGPDLLLGLDAPPKNRNIFQLITLSPEVAKKALRLRSIGQRTVEMIGGRGVHPVTVVAGGISSRPDGKDLQTIAEWGKEALELIRELGAKIMERLRTMVDIGKEMPLDISPLSLSNNGTHSFLDGEIAVVDGTGSKNSFKASEYYKNLVEHVMPASYMKSVRLRGEKERSYFVGPLARLMTNSVLSTPIANSTMDAFRKRLGTQPNALDNVEARLIEMIHCAERMIEIPSGVGSTGTLKNKVIPKEGRYIGTVEAPRGTLIHDYTADQNGRIIQANLIVATQNNYDAIDMTITNLARAMVKRKDDGLLLNGMEFALRCFDPCLSCATHVFGRMPLEISFCSGGQEIRKFSRS